MTKNIEVSSSFAPLDLRQLAECSEGLTTAPSDGQPFALSYDLLQTRLGLMKTDPRVTIWSKDGDWIRLKALTYNPESAQRHGLAALRLLDWSTLSSTVEAYLVNTFPHEQVLNHYLAVTPLCAVQVVEEWHSVQRNHGASKVAHAFIPKHRSSHEMIEALTNASEVIEAMLRFPEQEERAVGASPKVTVLPPK